MEHIVRFRENLTLLMKKKMLFLIMSKSTQSVTNSTFINIFKPERRQHTPSFFIQNKLYESVKYDEHSV